MTMTHRDRRHPAERGQATPEHTVARVQNEGMKPKAIALLSGGLDSTLAVKLILDQGIEVEALNFVTPFCTCNRQGRCEAKHVAEEFGIPSDFDLNDVNLLKVGRHFRLSPRAKAVVGRNEGENQRLLVLARQGDSLFEIKGCGSPVTLLRGEAGQEEIHLAAAITARYSDADSDEVQVHYGTDYAALSEASLLSPLGEDELTRLRI